MRGEASIFRWRSFAYLLIGYVRQHKECLRRSAHTAGPSAPQVHHLITSAHLVEAASSRT
jgi:hypothetical protein